VDHDGRTGVVQNTDAGGFSDLYMTVNTVPGATYTISLDVWTASLENTAGNAHCTSTDSNGQLAINAGPLQLGCEEGGFCDHGEAMLCPREANTWTTVTGEYTAVAPMTTLRLHGESAYTAYFDRFSMIGRTDTCNIIVNGGLKGPVIDNVIAGWETHSADISIVDFEGRSGVIRNVDAGVFSDIYQTVRVHPGVVYTVSYDVHAVNSQINTAGNELCQSTDSNGILAINSGFHNADTQAEFHLCPSADGDGQWTTVLGTYTPTESIVTIRLHGESQDTVYFDRVTMSPAMQ
jgi:hypothetical protein